MRTAVLATALVLGGISVLGCAASPWAPLPPLPPPSPRSAPQSASPEAMQEVMGELTQLGDIDSAAREGLMADLRDTDPKLWPQVVQQFKAAVAYRRQSEQREMVAKGEPHTESPTVSNAANRVVATGYASQTAPSNAATPANVATPAAQNAAWQMPVPGSTPNSVPNSDSAPPQPASASTAPPPTTTSAEPAGKPQPLAKQPETTAASAESTIPSAVPPKAPAAETKLPDTTAKGESPAKGSQTVREPSTDWQAPLSAAIGAMELELQKGPDGPDALQRQSQLRLLCLMAGRRDDAMKPLGAGTAGQKEFWTKQIYALDTWIDTSRTPDASRRTTETKRLLDEACMRLSEVAALGVRNLAFCTDIQSYGCYKAFKSDEFTADQELLLYAEVENFTSEPSAKGFHTALRSSYQIFDNRGQRVEDHDFTVTEEHCQNPRRDFFIGYHLRLPKRIYAGKYTLQLTIEDLKSQKVGQSSIEFTVRESARSSESVR